MHRKLPWYVPLMFVLTAGYLAIEVPFSVHLAAVLGGNATADDIHQIERFGRTLSGVAAAIAVVGMWHLPRMERLGSSRIRACVTGLVVGSVVGAATYMSLNAYADYRAWISDGQERKDAVVAVLAKRALMESGVADELGLDPHQWSGFVAAMPEIMSSEGMVASSGRAAIELASYAGEDVKQALGSPTDFKRDFFEIHFSAGRHAYEEYLAALDETKAAYANLDAQAEDAWATYKSRMDEAYPRGWPRRPGISAALAWRKVRFGSGIPVPESWNLRDKGVFMAAVMRKGEGEIVAAYTEAVEAQLGKGVKLKPGLSYERFLAVPAVQKKIRERMYDMDLPGDLVISPAMSDRSFETALYTPRIEKAVAEMRDTISAPASDFERGALAERGKEAVKARILPALALFLSLTGAVVHIFKFTGYGIQIAAHLARIRFLQIGLIRHAAAALVISGAANQYLDMTVESLKSPAVERISSGDLYASLLVGAVAVQPQLAELGDKLGGAGIWKLLVDNLPAPRPHAVGKRRSTPTDDAIQVASLVEPTKIPVPYPRPDR